MTDVFIVDFVADDHITDPGRQDETQTPMANLLVAAERLQRRFMIEPRPGDR